MNSTLSTLYIKPYSQFSILCDISTLALLTSFGVNSNVITLIFIHLGSKSQSSANFLLYSASMSSDWAQLFWIIPRDRESISSRVLSWLKPKAIYTEHQQDELGSSKSLPVMAVGRTIKKCHDANAFSLWPEPLTVAQTLSNPSFIFPQLELTRSCVPLTLNYYFLNCKVSI